MACGARRVAGALQEALSCLARWFRASAENWIAEVASCCLVSQDTSGRRSVAQRSFRRRRLAEPRQQILGEAGCCTGQCA